MQILHKLAGLKNQDTKNVPMHIQNLNIHLRWRNVLFQLEGLCINYDGITLLDTLIN